MNTITETNSLQEFGKYTNLPLDKLSSILEQNVYQTVLYGAPFQLADKYAYESRKYTYNDPRRLLGALTEAYLKKLSQGNTVWPSSYLSDETYYEDGVIKLKNKNSIQGEMSKVLLQSSFFSDEQISLFEWYDNQEGKRVPRINYHLFFATLDNMNELKLFNRKIFEFQEYNGQYQLRHLPSYWSELQICQRLVTLLKEPLSLNKGSFCKKDAISQFRCDAEQATAIERVFDHKVSIITGGPGTGKSRTIEVLSHFLLKENPNLLLRVCAPTGMAAQNLQQRFVTSASNEVKEYFSQKENQCKTIHSLLKIKPSSSIGICRTTYNYKNNPLDADVLIIEETSMVDIYLMRSLLWALPNHTHVVIVGDYNQLDSVGGGRVLYDLTVGLDKINQKESLPIVPSWTILKTIHRTKKDSRIPYLAETLLLKDKDERWQEFKKELENSIKTGDILFIEADEPSTILENTVNIYLNMKGYQPPYISLITPRHENGVGRIVLNETIQKKIMGKVGFYKGTLVIADKNDYQNGVLNGEKGVITRVTKDSITALFIGDREVTLPISQAEKNWLIGYATTAHKAQGTEAPIALLPIWSEGHKAIWNRQLLYTALTRSKKQIIFVGNKEALEQGVKRNGGLRLTQLPLLYRSQCKRQNIE
ncbi:ATP-dependent DNA helicase [Calidifontibacillus erzurumensis]|uniref:ATP-dependent DNA helicase n=1 Tax=Calidifontibacillus erzurumensis TaxID=2741433 RepID=UPI0035B50845